MRFKPTLSHIQRATRARVCATCPYRTPGTDNLTADEARPCEATCALFTHLPVLREAARTVDPMVGNRPGILRRLLDRFGHRRGQRADIAQSNGNRVVDLLAEFYD